MKLKKSLKSQKGQSPRRGQGPRRGQSTVEYLLLFLIVAVLSVTLAGKAPSFFSSFVSSCTGAMQ